MIKEMEYKKSFVELYELLKYLPADQIKLIPIEFLSYIYKNRDENYSFYIDENRGILEQDYMPETKALIVKLYEKYLSNENEKDFWNEYDKLCIDEIEIEKKVKYSSNLFEKNNNSKYINKNEIQEATELVVYKENIFVKIKKFFINIFSKK